MARCRYIRAAACPKDVVILLDVSGSMKGLRIEIAKATVEKILDTLTDDDFFNVIMVSRKPSPHTHTQVVALSISNHTPIVVDLSAYRADRKLHTKLMAISVKS